jgi:hypothetical protein
VRAHRHTGRKGLFISTGALRAHRRHRGREPGPAALPGGSRVLSELHRQLRLEPRRLRPLGQPGHLALRGQRLQRPPGVPQGHRRLTAGRWSAPWCQVLGRASGGKRQG